MALLSAATEPKHRHILGHGCVSTTHTNLGCVLHSPGGCAGLVVWHHRGKLDCPLVLGNNTEPLPAQAERKIQFQTQKQGEMGEAHTLMFAMLIT